MFEILFYIMGLALMVVGLIFSNECISIMGLFLCVDADIVHMGNKVVSAINKKEDKED